MSTNILTVSELLTLAEAAQELGLPRTAQQLVDVVYSMVNNEYHQPVDEIVFAINVCRSGVKLTNTQINILEKFKLH